MIKQAVRFGLCFAMLAFSQKGVATPQIPSALKQNHLVYCTEVSTSFNPQKADVGSNINVVTEQLYDKLVEFDPQKNAIRPALAERFTLSPDGLTATFYLRKKVAFHQTKWFTPTRFFNEDDVIFSLNRALGFREKLPALDRTDQHTAEFKHYQINTALANQAHFSYFESIDLKSKIESITAIKPNVVQIKLNRPDPALLAYLASPYAVMLSQEYALQLNADNNLAQLDLLPVGTGVYQLQDVVENDYARLVQNPHYWREKAQIGTVLVDFSSNGTGRMTKFLNKACDISAFPEPSQLAVAKQGKIIRTSGANLAYLGFNFQREKMQDLALRQKIAQAINRTRLAERLFYGEAKVADNVLPPALFQEQERPSYAYAPLAEGKTEGKTDRLILWVLDEKRVYNPHPFKMAELIRADLAQVGIDLTIKQVSQGYLLQQLNEGMADYDLILSGWLAHNLDPNGFLSSILGCRSQKSVTNVANWCQSDFDYLLETARSSEDPTARSLIYQLTQRILEEELPILPLLHANRLLIAQSDLEQVEISPFGQVNLAKIRRQEVK